MEKDEFAVAVSWINEPAVAYWIPNSRYDLGFAFGWTETDPPWSSDKTRLDQVHDLIVKHQAGLFEQLIQATDEMSRQQWLATVVRLTLPDEEEAARRQASGDAGGPRAPEPNGSPAPVASARRTAFPSAAGREASGDAGASRPAEPNGSPAPVASARRTAFPSAAPPQAEGDASGAKAAEHAVAPDSPGEGVGRADEQIQAVKSEITDLSNADLSTMARSLGLSPEEVEAMVQEPGFAEMVADQLRAVGA